MDENIGLKEAYAVQTPEDNKRLYAKWAKTYESDFVEAKKYRYPLAISEFFNEKVPTELISNVVDIGTGTGLVGHYLTQMRANLLIDGLDISKEMLAEAAKKMRADGSPVYRHCFERDLTLEVEGTSAPYDALISSGTFTHGHLGPEAINNLIPLVRQGGYFVIGANAEHFAARGFEAFIKGLAAMEIITEPEFNKIHVYDQGSPHYGDQSVVSLFRRA